MSAPADALAAVVDALAARLAELVLEKLSEHRPATEAKPALVDTAQLCVEIGVSRPTINKLIEQGCPFVLAGDHRRFSVARVVAWLEARAEREATAGLCSVCETPHEDASPGECRRAAAGARP